MTGTMIKFKRLPLGGCYIVEGIKSFPYDQPALRVHKKTAKDQAVCVRQTGYPNTALVGCITLIPNGNILVQPCSEEGYVLPL